MYQNIYTIERENPEYVLILCGDHIYKMDYSELLDFHVASGADATVSTIEFLQGHEPKRREILA